MKKLISSVLVIMVLFVLLTTPVLCAPYSVDVATDIGDFKVVINDDSLKSLSPVELQKTLKDVIENVGMGEFGTRAIYFPDEIEEVAGHTCSSTGPYKYKYGGNNYVYASDGVTLLYTFCIVHCITSSCGYLAYYIDYA